VFLPNLLPDNLDQPGNHRGPDQGGHEKHNRDANNQRYDPFNASHHRTSFLMANRQSF